MSQLSVYQKIQQAVQSIQSKTDIRPQIGIVLGSGLGAVAEQMQVAAKIPYKDIPHFHGTSVEGHAGRDDPGASLRGAHRDPAGTLPYL